VRAKRVSPCTEVIGIQVVFRRIGAKPPNDGFAIFDLDQKQNGSSKPMFNTGLWVIQRLPEDLGSVAEMVAKLRANPSLSGVCLYIAWNAIEGKSGLPDFALFDRVVAALRDIGMKYQLCLKLGANTLDYVYSEGVQSFATRVTNLFRANVGEAIRIPVSWDPVYERNFSRIIQQLGERYARDLLCVSVVLTCANFLSAEMHLPKTRSDLTRWQLFGNYEAKLFDVYKKFTDEWVVAFSRQEVSFHLSKVLDLPLSFCERIIDYGLSRYLQRFIIQNCQLTGRKEDTGMMTYDLVQKYRDRVHYGFQSLAGLSQSNERMGSIEMAALNLVYVGGEYWELWSGDGFSVETSATVSKTW